MKNTALLLLTVLFAQPTLAASISLHCDANSDKFDQKDFASFDITFNNDSVTIWNAVLSQTFLDQINQGITDIQNALDNPADPDRDADEKQLKISQAVLSVANAKLIFNGNVLPYEKQPKTPRLRFPLQSDGINTDVANDIVQNLAPESETLTIFVPITNGSPTYANLYIEYDGTQGPYYDHFACK